MHREPGASDRVSVQVLGTFQVLGGGVALGPRDLGGGKPRQIFEILAMHHGSTVTKARLVELLWPRCVPRGAEATLESYVSLLRQNLLPVCGSRTGLVRTGVGAYGIEDDSVDLDLTRFAGVVREAETAASDVAKVLLLEVLQLASQPLLPGEADSPWVEDAREHHEQHVVAALIAASQTASGRGWTTLAVRMADCALTYEPHNEGAWHAKILAYERAGQQAQALREYSECRSVLASELGCAPGGSLQATFRRLLACADDDLGDLIGALLRVRNRAAAPGGNEARRVLDSLVAYSRGPSGGPVTRSA